MKISVESTTKTVTLEINGAAIPARVWEGHTDQGTPVMCFITRIAPTIPEPVPQNILDEFAASLKECASPTPAVQAISMRMIL